MPTVYAFSHSMSMPHRMICLGTVSTMKPHQLIAALMLGEGLNPSSLARKIKRPELQPTIHRFVHGKTADPDRSTAEPLAAYFRVPTDAIYSEKVASLIAKERGLQAVTLPAPSRKKTVTERTEPPDANGTDDLQLKEMEAELLTTLRTLSPEKRLALMEFARHLGATEAGHKPPRGAAATAQVHAMKKPPKRAA